MSKYSYAKDTRTDSKYKSDFYNGTHNEKLAIEQFLIDLHLKGRPLYQYKKNLDKEFQTENGNWDYKPDYIIYTEREVPIEVKVQMTNLKDTIDLKCYQTYNLKNNRGFFLYCLDTHYAIIKPDKVMQYEAVISERFNGKKIFQVNTKDIQWIAWLHKPNFKKYENRLSR